MFVAPMLPEPFPEPFDDERYLFEPKFNGRRLILSFIDQKTTLYNQHRQDITRQYPELCRVPLQEPADIVLDGEAVYINPDTGLMELETVIERFRLKKAPSIREAASRQPLHYFIFDLLYYNGEDLRAWPLMERKRLLAQLIADNGSFHPVSYRDSAGEEAYELASRLKLDGIVAKRKDSVYVGERSADWLAVPRYEYTDAVITGYRKRKHGLLVAPEDGQAGLMEQEMAGGSRLILDLEQELKRHAAAEDRNYVYLQPGLKVRLRHRGLTRNGLMREPEIIAVAAAELPEA